jgi:restriction system protein
MLPLLEVAADGKVHSLAETRPLLAAEFNLRMADQEELLPSGRQPRFANRVAWAKVYLQQAGLLLSPRRGWFPISDLGQRLLEAPPERIDIKFLGQYPQFAEFRRRRGDVGGESATTDTEAELETPEETLEAAHVKMKASLASELLGRVKAASSTFVERMVVELLVRMGYGGSRTDAGQVVSKSGDEGIDGIISEDRLGLDIVYLQAKKWDGTVGRPEVQKFVGALHGRRARKGVLITTGTFSADATSYAAQIEPKVVLIDGRRLAELMIDFEVGVSTTTTYHVKRVDSDYFDET